MFWKKSEVKIGLPEIASLIFLCITAVVLIAFQLKPQGWVTFLIGIMVLGWSNRDFAKHVGLIYLSLALLGITPITTDISYYHMLEMSITLGLAVAIPYVISKYIFKDHLIHFRWHHGRNWYKKEIYYIALTAIIAYLLVPFYLANTNAYLNWSVTLEPSHILRLFIGTNGLGIWDELFFVSTVLGILRKYLSFVVANLIQAVLFTSFLYELGFTGWGPLMIYPFALIQGYIFKKTDSLFYVITIHLTLDFILFLALINNHYPKILSIFIT